MWRHASLVAFVLLFCKGAAAQEPSADFVAFAADLAKTKIAPFLIEHAPAQQKYRIGVFTFADRDGKYDKAEFGTLGQIAQGQLETALRPELSAAPGKYSMLTPSPGLKDAFDTANLDPQGIYSGGVDGARHILQSVNIQVGIIGRFDFKTVKDLPALVLSGESVKVTVTVILPTTSKDFEVNVKASDLVSLVGKPTNNVPGLEPSTAERFKVEFYLKKLGMTPDTDQDEATWEKLMLQVSTNPNSSFHNVYFLVLKNELKGRRYKIRLINSGVPTTSGQAEFAALQKDQLVAAALLIDGVNSLYEDTGLTDPATSPPSPIIGPVVRHPAVVSKWVLTSPGRKLSSAPAHIVKYTPPVRFLNPNETNQNLILASMQDGKGPKLGLGVEDRLLNGQLTPVSGAGGAIVDVRGFQTSDQFSNSFEFGDTKGSVAEGVGVTNDVGMIAVHFYNEFFPFPTPVILSAGGAATHPGVRLTNPIFRVKFRLSDNPSQVTRIFYRYEDEVPPDLNLQPVN
ncbi:MAG: hypothetical protein V4719_26130 [Planctomycetota bacterium]